MPVKVKRKGPTKAKKSTKSRLIIQRGLGGGKTSNQSRFAIEVNATNKRQRGRVIAKRAARKAGVTPKPKPKPKPKPRPRAKPKAKPKGYYSQAAMRRRAAARGAAWRRRR
jgi:hypothetical protein